LYFINKKAASTCCNKTFKRRLKPLFAGSLESNQRAAAVVNLIQFTKLDGHYSYAYLKNALRRLPTQKSSAIDELLAPD
jgi:hypothetical protein